MQQTNTNTLPTLEILAKAGEIPVAFLSGEWTLSNFIMDSALQKTLKHVVDGNKVGWDLTAVSLLDNATALWLWQAWGQRLPTRLAIKPEHQRLFAKWQAQTVPVFEATGFSINKTVA